MSAVDALEVAPRAQAGHVLVGVVAAVGAKAQVVRRDVAASAAGALAAMAIAIVARADAVKALCFNSIRRAKRASSRRLVMTGLDGVTSMEVGSSCCPSASACLTRPDRCLTPGLPPV